MFGRVGVYGFPVLASWFASSVRIPFHFITLASYWLLSVQIHRIGEPETRGIEQEVIDRLESHAFAVDMFPTEDSKYEQSILDPLFGSQSKSGPALPPGVLSVWKIIKKAKRFVFSLANRSSTIFILIVRSVTQTRIHWLLQTYLCRRTFQALTNGFASTRNVHFASTVFWIIKCKYKNYKIHFRVQ